MSTSSGNVAFQTVLCANSKNLFSPSHQCQSSRCDTVPTDVLWQWLTFTWAAEAFRGKIRYVMPTAYAASA